MVCTADDLLGWKDFPKGLRILLLDEDSNSAKEIKSKLEEMDYIVATFCNENEALTAISREPESFHVAILEVSTGNQQGCFKFLETAKDLPTIMTSNIQCLSTMMKCIALGAAEFLQKPLSEDKLRNIWQHVVHRAFNGGETVVPKSLKPIKETVVSMLQLQQDSNEADNKNLLETDNSWQAHECDHEPPTISDRFPAPSTPQLKQGGRLLDDGDCQDLPNCSLEKEHGGDPQEESKSVETTCSDLVAKTTCNSSLAEVSVAGHRVDVIKEDSHKVSKTGSSFSQQLYKESTINSNSESENSKKASSYPVSCRSKANRKKMKVDWTPELHKQFVKAVEQLGVDQAIPSRILELMKVEGLTRHNVASHLQKYRMHRRHILPKEEDRRWQHPIDPMQRVYAQKPMIAYPRYHPNHGLPASQYYPVWGHPSTHLSGGQMWGHPGYPTWHHRPDIWPWKTHPGMHVDSWSYPMIPQSQAPYSFLQNAYGFNSFHSIEDSNNIPKSSFDFHLDEEEIDEEEIDKVVKEAMSKPWLPLPLGLKPPSTESVLTELHRQGISNIPPHSQC